MKKTRSREARGRRLEPGRRHGRHPPDDRRHSALPRVRRRRHARRGGRGAGEDGPAAGADPRRAWRDHAPRARECAGRAVGGGACTGTAVHRAGRRAARRCAAVEPAGRPGGDRRRRVRAPGAVCRQRSHAPRRRRRAAAGRARAAGVGVGLTGGASRRASPRSATTSIPPSNAWVGSNPGSRASARASTS